MKNAFFIGIAGGSGSGKTTITSEIISQIGKENVTIIEQDSYYVDLGHLSFEERKKINFDHPDAFDLELLKKHLMQLKKWESIEKPFYNFVIHTREKQSVTVNPTKIIIIEGILIFYDQELRDMMDIRIFIDTDADIRLIRRIRRDMIERGRSLDSVLMQYETTVRPMHFEFVEPAKRFAHIIIPEGYNKPAIDFLIERLRKEL
jgi:uridine kinase